MGLNTGAQMTHGGQVQRQRQGVVEIEFLGKFAELNLYLKHGLHGNEAQFLTTKTAHMSATKMS